MTDDNTHWKICFCHEIAILSDLLKDSKKHLTIWRWIFTTKKLQFRFSFLSLWIFLEHNQDTDIYQQQSVIHCCVCVYVPHSLLPQA